MASLISILQQAGFKGEALKIAYAIAMAESGGNARAYNGKGPDNSYGLFQINMLGNMGPARRKQYGLSSNDDLFDPLTNAKVAFKLSNGGKNWQPWATYTGSDGKGSDGPWRTYYGGSMGATITNNSSGPTGSGSGVADLSGIAAVTPKLDKYELMEKYGLTAATINANKEIKNLFNQAVAGQWDAELFTAKLKNTKWWRTTSDSQRKYFMLKTGDPATYTEKFNGYAYSLNQLAVEVGLGNQLANGKPNALLSKAIAYKMRDGWDDARLKAYFGSMVTLHGDGPGGMWGEAGEAYDQIFQLMYSNGLDFSKKWFQDNVRNVVAGKTTTQALETYVRNTAAAKYSAFAQQIHAGQNAMDLAQPYISSVAQLLELPSTSIDLTNKYVNKAMTAKVVPGQKPGTQYPLWQFENDVRSDPLWVKTNNAREGIFSVAHQVAKDFGFAF